jgi:hypothetical protein
MGDDVFTERLASVRKRFAAKLISRIAEIDAGLPACAGENAGAAVFTAHLKVLDLCGNGPTLGFVATGQAARVCDTILLQPWRDRRGLTEQELATLRNEMAALRVAAHGELQSNSAVVEGAH